MGNIFQKGELNKSHSGDLGSRSDGGGVTEFEAIKAGGRELGIIWPTLMMQFICEGAEFGCFSRTVQRAPSIPCYSEGAEWEEHGDALRPARASRALITAAVCLSVCLIVTLSVGLSVCL